MMSFIAKYCLIYPVHLLRGENMSVYMREIQKAELLEPGKLRTYQKMKLENNLRKAVQRGHLYNFEDFLDRGRSADSLISADIRDLPFLNKKAVQKAEGKGKAFFMKRLKRLDRRSTSGSTGMPLIFYRDRESTGYMDAVMYRAYSWHGIEVGDPQARFWGVPLADKDRRKAMLKDFLKNRIRFSAFDLDVEAKEKFLSECMELRPRYFYGYPSLMVEFADFVRTVSNKNFLPRKLKAIIGTGEYVFREEREALEEVFQAPFISEYGCTEVGVIGLECPRGKLHLMAPNILLEIIRDGRPVLDEEGEICVTELNSSYFPFIRYLTGDRGALLTEKCPCGRSLPVFEILAGRKDDYIITAEGKKVYDAVLAYTLKAGISQFLGIQKRIGELEVLVRANERFNSQLKSKYIEALKAKLGETMKISIHEVERIERRESGKIRYFESMLNHRG